MGCCNKKLVGEPIGRGRYLLGATAVVGVHGGVWALLYLGSFVSPRCRRVLPFFTTYARETVASVLARDRIRLKGERAPNPECELPV